MLLANRLDTQHEYMLTSTEKDDGTDGPLVRLVAVKAGVCCKE